LSTHPPVDRRLDVLLGMAHAGRAELEAIGERPPLPADTALGTDAPPQRWRARNGATWSGPFTAAELVALPWFGPFTPVTAGEPWLAAPAWEDAEINRLLKKLDVPSSRPGACPACGGVLVEVAYDGVPLHKCGGCSGRLVAHERFARILARGEPQPPAAVHAMALRLVGERLGRGPGCRAAVRATDGLVRRRPSCGGEMKRFAYEAVLPHRIILDRCDPCGLLWFDGNELELIQDVLALFGG